MGESGVPKRQKKRPLFMKIYNFAGEVYDSAGLRIGRRRSCGHGGMGTYFPWGYIAAAVFGVAHSLNSCNTNPFLASFFAAPGRASFCPPSSSTSTAPPLPPSQKNMESPRCDGAVRAELMCRLMCVKMRDDRTRGRWDYLGKNHLNKVGHSSLLLCPLLLGVGGLRGGERSSGGVAATQGWWIINKGKGRRHTDAAHRPLAPPRSDSNCGLSQWKYQRSAAEEDVFSAHLLCFAIC